MAYDRINAIFEQVCSQHLYPVLASEGYAPTCQRFYEKTDGDVQFRVSAILSRKPKETVGSIELAAAVAFRRLWSFLKQFERFDRTSMFTAAGVGGRVSRMFPRDVRPSWYFFMRTAHPMRWAKKSSTSFESTSFLF